MNTRSQRSETTTTTRRKKMQSISATLLLLIAVHSTTATAATCSLCPNGRVSDAPWLSVAYKDYEMTCAAAEEYALNLDADSDACTALVEALAFPCRCFPEDVTCPMCVDPEEAPLLSSSDCRDVYRELPLMPLGSVECSDSQIIAQGSGCCAAALQGTRAPPPLVQDRCSLCADGSVPLRDLTETIDGLGGKTCNDLQAQTSVSSNSSQVCFYLQSLGIRSCQCPAENFRQCKLCAGENEEDENPPFPDAIADLDGKTTCADLHQSVFESADSCPTIQAKGYFFCSCSELPVLEEGSCSLCHDPNESYTNNVFETRKLDDGSQVDVYCSDAAAEIFVLGNDKKCAQAQAQAAISCGCKSHPTPPVDPSCTLCPGGMDPESPNHFLTDLQLSCHTFNQLVPSLFDGSSCGAEQLSSYQHSCGCPTQATCRLCNLGDDIVDPNKVVVNPTQEVTCADIDQVSHTIKLGPSIGAFQHQCQNFRDEYASECCPGSSIEPLSFGFPSPAPSVVPNLVSLSNENDDSGGSMMRSSLWLTLIVLLVL